MNTLRIVILCGAVVLSLAFIRAANAQNALGGGHALDGNLQRGSGGRNSGGGGDQRIDYRTQNDLITGNVTGSRYFRDNVNYLSTGEFGGRTGGDDLFRFRAETAQQGAALLTGRTFGSSLRPQSVYRDAAPVTGAGVRANRANTSGLYGSRGLDGRIFDPGTLTGRSTTTQRATTRRIGTYRQPDGRLLDVTISPLTGLRTRETGLPRVRRPDEKAPETGIDPRLTPLMPGQIPEKGKSILDPLPPWAQPYHGNANPASMELGRLLQNLITGKAAEERTAADARRKAIEESMFGPLDRLGSAPGDDIYLDILRGLRERTQGDVELLSTDPFKSEIALEKPTAEQIEAAEKARRAALKARGIVLPDDDEAPDDEATKNANRLVNALDTGSATVESMAGNRKSMTNKLLRQAEEAMAAGRYFDAEQSYRRVLQFNPGYPLAKVGLIHSQLGAGLVRSAAGNLREVFSAHPEIIAVHYKPGLLPNKDRLVWARGELESMIDRTSRQEPALLLAYLGYQTANDELVRYGLAKAETRQPGDPLIGLLRRIWLARDKASKPKPETAPEAAPDSTAPDSGAPGK